MLTNLAVDRPAVPADACTTNLPERLSREIKRRTRVAGLSPNEASLLHLVSAVLMEISEEREISKLYLRMEDSGLNEPEEE